MDGLSHVGLKSANLDVTERFYTQVLDGEVFRRREEPDRRIWMTVGGARLEIAEMAPWTPFDDRQRLATPAVSFLASPAEVDEIAQRLRDLAVPHRGPVLKATGQAVGLYFGDPDGNSLSLSCPEGYPADGLDRNTAGSWAAAPYDWSGAPATVR
jgi:catechol 2,3-dioxygenase-like lactoylglutathione lyase family enzyme